MTLKQRLALFAFFYILVICLIGWVASNAVNNIRRDLNRLNYAHVARNEFNDLRVEVTEFMIIPQRWAYTTDPIDRSELEAAYPRLKAALAKARTAADSVEENALILKINGTLNSMQQLSDALFKLDPYISSKRVRELLKFFKIFEKELSGLCKNLDHLAESRAKLALAESDVLQLKLYRFLVLTFFLVLALTSYFIVRVARWITEPISSLMEGTKKISEGNFNHRIEMQRNDEFGTLSSTFNEMARVLGRSHTRLSAKLLESETLMEVSRVANSTLEIQSILQMITEIVAEQLDRDVCSIYLISDDGKSVVLRATKGLKTTSIGKVCLGLDEGIVGRAAKELRPIPVPDVKRDPRFKGIPITGEAEFSSILAVPIVREGIALGVITLQTRAVYNYSRDETDLLTLISHNVASVIRNAELYENMRRQLQRLNVIHDLGMAINSILDLDQLLPDICRRTAELLRAEGAIVRLLEGEENALIIKASYGLPEGLDVTKPLPLGEGIAGKVARDGKPMLVEDTRDMPLDTRVPGVETRSVMAVPLKVGTHVIGTIGHYNKRINGRAATFTNDDLETLSAVASMAAIAIENARLYREEKLREEEVRMAGQRLETLFESVQGGIITVDRDLVILSANRYVERWIEDGADNLVNRKCSEVFSQGFETCLQNPVKAAFEVGKSTKVPHKGSTKGMQFYAEITTYPMRNEKGDVQEVIVFIQDITDRMNAQKKILSLYSEVSQTKKYLESLIANSADAIITTDVSGQVTSWNKGAEKIYGYTAEEVLGKPVPVLPDFLLPAEAENAELVKRKETLRDIETLRRNKDGSLIEVSLTLSPILDEDGEVIGVSGISRDISDKRRVEQELTRRNQELSRLLFISNAMRSTLDINRLLRMMLTAVTMSDGLGFNRALLFEVDEDARIIKGVMGVGPGSLEEAWRIWGELAMERKTLEDIMKEIVSSPVQKESFLDQLATNLQIPMNNDSESILTTVVREKKPVNVLDVRSDDRVDPILIQLLGTEAFALIPLISQNRVVGVLWVDNLFNLRPITEDDIRFLSGFANHVASAIENARLFEKVSMAEAELENIFESISDMVYFNDKDFTIKKVNRAVEKKIGLPEQEIIGKKCYEVFHGTNEPCPKCPHAKTIKTGKSYVEELEGLFPGGTYLISSSPIFDLSGGMIGTVHVSRNISESKRLREKLLKAEKLAALGEMAAKIAHEIRNPLISVGGFARRLEKKLEGPLKDYATIMVDSVNHLEVILKDILGFVRETPILLVKGDLVEIMDQLISLFSPSLKERGISIEKDYREISLEVPVDSNKIREALTNFIANAEQAMEDGGKMSIRLYCTEKDAVIEVQDTGTGMTEYEQRHIFDPFFTTKISGTGLGMAITQRIIDLHRGRIEVKSEVGVGTTFKIYLPLEEE